MGTILLTGANGSLAIPAVDYLLSNFPDRTAVLTVRNDADANTKKLRDAIARHPNAKASVRTLDLADLAAVKSFASTVATEIAEKKLPPLNAIICNAYHWNLNGSAELTGDGLERTLQVNHVSHVALVISLLRSFDTSSGRGRIVFLGSDAHEPGKNALEKFPPRLPANLDDLAGLESKYEADKRGWGFWRYGVSKLLNAAFTHALNRQLEKNPELSSITAVCIWPGGLCDSRALQTNSPTSLKMMQRFFLQPMRPVLQMMNPTVRTSAAGGIDVIKLATSAVHPGERGYFTMLNKESSAPDSLDEANQNRVWEKSLEWAGVRL